MGINGSAFGPGQVRRSENNSAATEAENLQARHHAAIRSRVSLRKNPELFV